MSSETKFLVSRDHGQTSVHPANMPAPSTHQQAKYGVVTGTSGAGHHPGFQFGIGPAPGEGICEPHHLAFPTSCWHTQAGNCRSSRQGRVPNKIDEHVWSDRSSAPGRRHQLDLDHHDTPRTGIQEQVLDVCAVPAVCEEMALFPLGKLFLGSAFVSVKALGPRASSSALASMNSATLWKSEARSAARRTARSMAYAKATPALYWSSSGAVGSHPPNWSMPKSSACFSVRLAITIETWGKQVFWDNGLPIQKVQSGMTNIP